MKGPISKESKLSLWPGWLEAASIFCGLVVVTGLAIESGPDIVALLEHHVPLPRSLWGEALVTVGVFGEVAIGIFIARESKRAQSEAEERIAIAEKDAAEANLARAKIEQRLRPRTLLTEDHKELRDLLALYPKMGIDIVVFDHHILETLSFAAQMMALFASAGWIVRADKPPARPRHKKKQSESGKQWMETRQQWCSTRDRRFDALGSATPGLAPSFAHGPRRDGLAGPRSFVLRASKSGCLEDSPSRIRHRIPMSNHSKAHSFSAPQQPRFDAAISGLCGPKSDMATNRQGGWRDRYLIGGPQRRNFPQPASAEPT